jgi:hypothetical protein
MSSLGELAEGIDLRSSDGRRRAAVVACASAALVVGVLGAVDGLLEQGERAGENARRDWAEREFGGANSLGADKEALYAARALIPPGSSYRLLLGDPIPGGNELSARGLPDFTRHFLLPRRPAEQAEWVICYGCDPAALGDYTPVWDGGAGISVGTVGP